MSNQHTISPHVQDLIAVFQQQGHHDPIEGSKDEPKIKVHETIGKVAYAYEKVRVAIDYQDEHLIRKNAIARMLKRRIFSKERGSVIAEPLIRELIRAGYLPNDYFPERRLPDIERIINKYVALIDATNQQQESREHKKIVNWILSVAAFELEEYFSPSIKDDAVVELMYKTVRPQIDLGTDILNPEDQDIQVYIAVHRALIKSDLGMLRYHLIYYYAPQWRYSTTEEIQGFAKELPQLINRIDQQITHQLSDRLFNYMKKFSPLFTVTKDVLSTYTDNASQVLADPQQLQTAITEATNKRYADAATRLNRGVFRSIIYIFLTKTIMAFVFELPYEAFIIKEIKLLPLAINVMFHPMLMFMIATSIRVPAEENTARIIQGIQEFVYDLPEKEILKKREEKFRGGSLLGGIFNFLYSLAYVISFGFIIWVLIQLNFSIVSGLLFVFFLSVISFFGLRLRQTAKELVIVTKRESLLVIVFDFFAMPILRVGRWLSKQTSKVNVFMFLMDFIIEAPFKVLVETVEDWVSFQREKKEETF